jgi:CheY-like chemotaxis protein/HPt (histidine-containing phosphotransfer) domain-containing protein
MFSSLGQREAGEQVEAAQFAAYLNKPIKPSQMFDALVSIFADEPMTRPEATVADANRLDPELGKRHPLRILLAEDNAVNQKLAVRLLQQMGYRADIAGNGLEALESIERQPYDVVLMDVQMPDMDGLEASRQICAKWPREERPRIIAMTANAMTGDREICLEAGMDDYITKPIRVNELVAALAQCKPRPSKNKPAEEAVGGAAPGDGTNAIPPATVIEMTTLEQLRTTMGADFAKELIELFLKDTPKLLDEIRENVAAHNGERVRRAAHTIRSNSATVGAMAFAGLAKEMEALCKAGELERAYERASQLEADFSHVKRALEAI